MNIEDYRKASNKLDKEHSTKKAKLMREFAESNSEVSVGDFVTDRMGSIKVEKITLYGYHEMPSLVYHGPEYTKKMARKKSGAHRSVYQMNLVKQGLL